MTESVLDILQFTDLHIVPPDEQPLWPGIDTLHSCRATLTAAIAERPDTGLFLLTGDLSHRPTPQSYGLIRDCVCTLPGPIHFIPGNHDDPKLMATHLRGGNLRPERSVSTGPWQVILLDTTVPGETGGALAPEQLAYLEHRLSRQPSRFALIALHHHPLPIGSPWMDAIALANAEALFRIIDRHPQVRGMIWGHIHQDFEVRRQGVLCMGTPSTCIQFTPHSDEIETDRLGPAYRHLSLLPSGEIQTRVHYLQEGPGTDPCPGPRPADS